KHILVATNFSTASSWAIDRAVALANQCDAVLTILHVIDINTQSQSETAEQMATRLRADAFARMGELAGSLCGQVNAQTIIEDGLPADTIIEKSLDFDLLILGLGGPKSGWQVFSKHTVEHVLKESACPVMIVRKTE